MTARDYDTRPTFEQRLRGLLKRRVKRRAQRALRVVLGGIGYLLRERESALPALRAGDPAIRRILVVRVDLLGDTLLSTAAVRALRRGYPHVTIDMLVTTPTAPLLVGDPDIAHLLPYNPHIWRTPASWRKLATWRDAWRFLRHVRAQRYDLAISASGDIGSIVTRFTGARRRVGYAGEAYPYFMTDTVPGQRYARHQHEVRYVLDLAAAAGGIVAPEDAQLQLTVQPQARQHVAALLADARARLERTGPVIALHAGAQNGQAKRWPPAHFAALAQMLITHLDALVVLTGAPGDRPIAEQVLGRMRQPVLDLVGQTTLPELTALLAASDVLVTGDSGPMHIACATGTAVVALHGPTDPAISGPTAPDALVLRQPLWCSPCYDASETAECRFGNPVCMKTIAPGVVFVAVRRQLQRRGWHAAKKAMAPDVAAPSHP